MDSIPSRPLRLTRREARRIVRQLQLERHERRWALAYVVGRVCGDVMAGTTPRGGH